MKNSTLVRTVGNVALAGLAAAILAACSGGEPQVVIPKSTAQLVKEAEAKEAAAPKTEKLAQVPAPQAAPQPAPKAAPEPAPQAAPPVPAPVTPRAPEPAPRAQAPAREAKAPPPAPAVPPPAPVARPAVLDASSRESLSLLPSPGFVERPEPSKAEARAEPVLVAAAAPAAAPARPAGPTRVLSRVEPDFPRAAFQARVDRGQVKARVTLDGNGNVTKVDIVEAHPRRVFDGAVMTALAQWKFNDGAAGRTYDTEVVFQR